MITYKYQILEHSGPALFTLYTSLAIGNWMAPIPVLLATFYWWYMIRKNVVRKDYAGSWKSFFKSFWK